MSFFLSSRGAFAQAEFPNRLITIVVADRRAGSATDGAARTVAQELSGVAKQPVIVDNRPGAGGVIGTAYAAKAAPDGYTIMLGNNGTHAANVTLLENLQYDPIKDFAPIMLAERAPAFLVVNAESPIKSIGEFLQSVRAKPGSASVGVFSVSGIVAATMLKSRANIDFVQIPYKTPSARNRRPPGRASRWNFRRRAEYNYARAERQGACLGGHLANAFRADAGRSNND